MAGPGFRAVGVARLSGSLRVAESRLAALTEGNDEIARIALEATRSEAPVRSDRLRSSGRVQRVDTSPGVVFGVIYAGPINWGWRARHIEPAHFLEAGAVAAEPRVEQQLEKQAREILATVKGA